MPSPSDRRYSETHEWHRLDGDILTIGVTQHAVEELTDVTYVDLHEPGSTVAAGGAIGEIESVKATSEIYSAAPGEIIEINESLADDPGAVNRDPYGDGWLCRIRVSDATPIDAMMESTVYDSKYPAG